MAIDFTERELVELDKIVGAQLFKVKGADRIRLLIILRKIGEERVQKIVKKLGRGI